MVKAAKNIAMKPVNWLTDWLESKAITWLAGKIGVSPEWIRAAIPFIIELIKEVIGYLGKDGAQVYFQRTARKLSTAKDEKKAVQLLYQMQDGEI